MALKPCTPTLMIFFDSATQLGPTQLGTHVYTARPRVHNSATDFSPISSNTTRIYTTPQPPPRQPSPRCHLVPMPKPI